MPVALQEQIKTNFLFYIFIIWLRHTNWYSCMQSLMTAFEGFSVSLDRTVFFSKQKCKLLSDAGLDINQKNEECSPMPFIGNSLCHFPPIISPWSFLLDRYVQKYGSATSTFALNSYDLWLFFRVCLPNHFAKMAALSQPFQLLSLPIPMKLNGCNYELFLENILYIDRTSEGGK